MLSIERTSYQMVSSGIIQSTSFIFTEQMVYHHKLQANEKYPAQIFSYVCISRYNPTLLYNMNIKLFHRQYTYQVEPTQYAEIHNDFPLNILIHN